MRKYELSIPRMDVIHYQKLGKEKEAKAVVGRLKWYHDELCKHNRIKHSFYDVDMRDWNKFIDYAFSESRLFYIASHRHFPVGHVCLDQFNGKTAMVHFGVIKKAGRDIGKIMEDSLDSLFAMTALDGTPMVEALIGLTPMYNKPARKAVYEAGYKHLAVLPKAAYVYWKDRYVDCALTMRCRNGEGRINVGATAARR